MSTISEIPLIAQPQRLSVTLSGESYQLLVTWNAVSECWLLRIADSSGVVLVSSIPLVTGTDLLEQFEYLGLGGELQVQTDGDVDAIPTFTNLGIEGRLYWIAP